MIVPSKFYGIAAAGRPTIFIGARDGEIARVVEENGCGFSVAPGDGAALMDRILQLARDHYLCASLGARARATFERQWDKEQPHSMGGVGCVASTRTAPQPIIQGGSIIHPRDGIRVAAEHL